MSFHEHQTNLQGVKQLLDPLIEPAAARQSLLTVFVPLALLIVGAAIVTPAWIGLLGWLVLRLFGWL